MHKPSSSSSPRTDGSSSKFRQLGGSVSVADLTCNLNGTIPPEWGSTKLVNVSLLGNRLTGSIPKELGNITTLASLTIEFNHLSGVLPPELGNLPHLERPALCSNNFTGELPPAFAKLTTMRDFWIVDTDFTGKIPKFIQNWTNLDRLVIQASGLEEPIPTGIASLEKLTQLRISDLNGPEATFPPLSNMTSLRTLILRNCNITGQLPKYLGEMSNLSSKDLSFNRLSGEIPSNFKGLSSVNPMYLTRNLLTGPIPDWMLKDGKYIDLSYNSFTSGNLSSCQQDSVNLFRSSTENNNSGIVSCLRSTPCPRTIGSLDMLSGIVVGAHTRVIGGLGLVSAAPHNTNQAWNSFHINCGGNEVSINGNSIYEEDTFQAGPSSFFKSDKLMLKDFNIEDEAQGAGEVIMKTFPAVVTNSTLEILFYWAGKGTTVIPERGVYGPLISAISVINPEFPENGSSISVGIVVGIVAAVIPVIILILGILSWKGSLRDRDRMDQDLKGLDLQTGWFTLRQIKAATNNFDAANKIGEGGFGPVYKGLLSDGTRIAVKQLSSISKQGNREFVNELGMISALHHPHLVKLYGCCVEGNQLLPV